MKRERSVSSSLIVPTSLVTILVFLAWAFWAEIDQISRASGQVIPSGRVQVVQSADGGVVSELKVREGDVVEKGQLLVRLDAVKARAAYDDSRAKEAALVANLARLEAELYDKPLQFPEKVIAYREFLANQQSLYAKRREAVKAELDTLSEMLSLVTEELGMNQPLLETGDVSRSEVLRLQRQVTDLQGQLANRRNRYLQELQTEMSKTQEELASAEQLRRQREDQLSYTDLYSPAAGIVKNVRFTTVGAVLRPGDEMLTIVPTDDELIVEAKVRPADIAFVRLGQSATVKFDAYDSSIYGSGMGAVSYISADTLVEQTSRGENPYYRVHVTVKTDSMKVHRQDETIEIQPGMTATVEIKTGESTVLRYITKPITKTLSESLSER
jgi:adhesin transport system membrane fusion protein